MIPRKVQKGVAALTILAIAANTALNFFSQTYQISPDAGAPNGRNGPNDGRRFLSSSGLINEDPNSARFYKIFKRRIQRTQRAAKLREDRTANRQVLRRLDRNKKNIHYRKDAKLRDELENEMFERQVHREAISEEGDETLDESELNETGPLTVCDRNADVGQTEDFALLQQYQDCQSIDSKSVLLLEGTETFGRTGNNLIEFLHALQYARDNNLRLFIMRGSWAMQVILKMWMAIQDDDWESQFEQAFCVKIIPDQAALDEYASQGYDIQTPSTRDLFIYRSQASLNEYMESQEFNLRTLFRSYNTGEGVDARSEETNDMCSGIKALFGKRPNERKNAIYSVIHSRYLEGEPGKFLLGKIAKKSGCDPEAALEMTPQYVKSILGPLGMLRYPIVIITDGQNFEVIKRLLTDPDLGKLIHFVPEDASWVGGDITLAIMSNVFIGNPASTFSTFIAKSRLALGFGNNYLFRAKDKHGHWRTTCGDSCVFDKDIMQAMM